MMINHVALTKECLMHGDFHTSNTFANQENFKAIDMEYAMSGPFSYDIGYFLANIVSQFAAFSIRKDEDMCAYLLEFFAEFYQQYFAEFDKLKTGENTELFTGILQDSLAYLAFANINRTAFHGEFPDFDYLKDEKERFLAKCLSMKITNHLLENRKGFSSYTQVVERIQQVKEEFFAEYF
jgi:S-methyl-5-thioribose kinase